MQPTSDQVNDLNAFLTSLHGTKLPQLTSMAGKFAAYLKSLSGFNITNARLAFEEKHVGRVIVDGVLQVGHDYEKQVRKAVKCILQFKGAATISGFIELLNKQPLNNIINFSSDYTKADLLSVAQFFTNKSLQTYDDLYNWLQPEQNRDALLSANSGLQGKVFTIGDKTADYFRVLVRHWDAIAVDRGIKGLLNEAGLISRYSKKYSYKELRSIVQLTAVQQFNCRPLDLDGSIYEYYVRQKSTNKHKKLTDGDVKFCIFCGQQIPKIAKYCSQCGKPQP